MRRGAWTRRAVAAALAASAGLGPVAGARQAAAQASDPTARPPAIRPQDAPPPAPPPVDPLTTLDRTGWPRRVTIGAAPEGGLYFTYADAVSRLLAARLRLEGGPEPTGGSLQNVALVQGGDMVLGFTALAPAAEALAGRNPMARGLRMTKLRAIFPMYETYFVLAARQGRDIDTLADLPAGARLGVGPAGGVSHLYFTDMLRILGQAVTPATGPFPELVEAFRAGALEGFALASGVPNPLYAELEREGLLKVVGFTNAERNRLTEVFPVAPAVIPARAYRSLSADANAVAMWSFAIGNVDLPESFVYAVVAAVMEGAEVLSAAHPAAQATRPGNAAWNTVLPWHRGAVRWFEENGVSLPARLKD